MGFVVAVLPVEAASDFVGKEGAFAPPTDKLSVAGFLEERTSAPAGSSSRDRLVPVAFESTFWVAFEAVLLVSLLDAIVFDSADAAEVFRESAFEMADFAVEEVPVFF